MDDPTTDRTSGDVSNSDFYLRRPESRLETLIRYGFAAVGGGAFVLAPLLYLTGWEDLAALAFAAGLATLLLVMVAMWGHANHWRWRFGLGEMLVAMTVISIGMGALVYAIRN